MENFYAKSVEECLSEVNSSKKGLTLNQIDERKQKYGLNKLETGKKKNWLLSFLKQFTDVMIILLIVSGAISITFAVINHSQNEIIDAAVIFFIVILNGITGFVQEFKAEKSMESLKKMTVNECRVIRDGITVKIKAEEVTVGDIVFLEAGDIVPADIRLIETVHFQTQESSLTGESNSIDKNVEILPEITALADRSNMAFLGTSVTYGRALGVVVAVGKNTEMGKIANLLKDNSKTQTPIQKNLKILGRFITLAVLLISVVIFVLEIFSANVDYLSAFMIAVAVAVAAIPESLPAVVTVIMSLGVNKLARKKAIVKSMSAIEILGCCEIICSDKTGTLTENKMTVVGVYDMNNVVEIDFKNREKSIAQLKHTKELDLLLKNMALCNTCVVQDNIAIGDPTETALVDFANVCGENKNLLMQEFKIADEFPFDSIRKMMTMVFSKEDQLISFTKGGVDEVLSCCTHALIDGKKIQLTKKIKEEILSVSGKFASNALRVLAFAYSESGNAEIEMTFTGLVGMIDPPRKEAFDAVKACKKAGMTPIMITGDHSATAYEIARRLGIATSESQVITGAELDRLSDEEFMKILTKIKVYARVTPENKVRIVKAYKSIKKIVAMTGDGVNDAPSIKTANIGIGMGISGTDISKQAADIIVSDDNFATIIVAVEEGRKIYKNIEKTIKFLLSANIAETLSVLIATLVFPQFVFLLPVQILFVNLITDSIPSIALGLEPAEKDVMTKKPRDAKESFLNKQNLLQIFSFGIFQTAVIIATYLIGLKYFSPETAQAMAFYSLNLVQIFYILEIRTERSIFKSNPLKNKFALYSFAIIILFLTIISFTPAHNVLHLTNINLTMFGIIIGLSFAIIPLCEIYKFIEFLIKKRKNKVEVNAE